MGKKCKACGERVETAGKLQHQIEMLQAVSEQVDEFWNEADRRFSMEGRAFLEDYAKRIYGDKKFTLSAAVHFMWKRDAKVAELEAKMAEATEKQEAAEHRVVVLESQRDAATERHVNAERRASEAEAKLATPSTR